MARLLSRTLLAVVAGALAGCTSWREEQNLLVTSEPLGARILVDGLDTGYTTPKSLAIGGNFGADHVIRLEKTGYHPTNRTVRQYTEGYTSKWIDGAYEVVMVPLPFFWSPGDMFFPFGVRGALVPDQLHVRLQRDDEPLLGFDLLAARREQQDQGQ